MFLVHVNFAAISEFFLHIYSLVTFIPNPLCYHKYVIIYNMFSSILIVTENRPTSKTVGVLDLKVK